MRILEYTGLDTSGATAAYRKVTGAIARGDFRVAQVKKLANLSHGKFYRARLDGADRLLFALVRHAAKQREIERLRAKIEAKRRR